MSEFMDIITSDNLSYKQKVLHLAQAAENSEHPIKTTAEFDRLFAGQICSRVYLYTNYQRF